MAQRRLVTLSPELMALEPHQRELIYERAAAKAKLGWRYGLIAWIASTSPVFGAGAVLAIWMRRYDQMEQLSRRLGLDEGWVLIGSVMGTLVLLTIGGGFINWWIRRRAERAAVRHELEQLGIALSPQSAGKPRR